MKFLQNKKIIFIALLVIVVLGFSQIKVFGAPLVPQVDLYSKIPSLIGIGDIRSTVIGWGANTMGLIMGFIGGVLFTLAGWLVSFALNINESLLSSPTVNVGWQIVLGFTNLGFVLAIIIIAFATIFRRESYAMKQVLWKMIFAALLVNFSLMIAGIFINVADGLTHFFLQKTASDPTQFAVSLAGMFKAQALLKFSETITANNTLTGVVEGSIGTILPIIASVFFVAIFTFLGALTLLAIAIMLLIRYIYLGILLVLAPIVWLLWIFPGTNEYWKKWWHKFIRWSFFAPISMFFFYLAMMAMKGQPEYMNKILQQTGGGQISIKIGVDVIGNMIIVIGLLLGGLIAANELGISFAGTAYGWAQSTGKIFGSWVGRKGLQYGPGALLGRKGAEEGAKSRAERIQEWAAKQKPGIVRWGAGLVAGGTARLATAGGEDLVNRAKKELEAKSLLELKNVAETSLDIPKKIAANNILKEKKELGNQNLTRLLTVEQKNKFNRYGQGKAFSDIEKSVGKSVEMMSAAMGHNIKGLNIAAEKFAKSLKMEDIKKGHWNDIYSEKSKFKLDEETNRDLLNSFTGALAKNMPGAFAKIMPQLKAESLSNFGKIADKQIEILEKGVETEEDMQTAIKARDSFKKNLGWLSLGMASEEMGKPEGA